jgi:hypothetical protein
LKITVWRDASSLGFGAPKKSSFSASAIKPIAKPKTAAASSIFRFMEMDDFMPQLLQIYPMLKRQFRRITGFVFSTRALLFDRTYQASLVSRCL